MSLRARCVGPRVDVVVHVDTPGDNEGLPEQTRHVDRELMRQAHCPVSRLQIAIPALRQASKSLAWSSPPCRRPRAPVGKHHLLRWCLHGRVTALMMIWLPQHESAARLVSDVDC
jgi:hypothetical protein